MALTRVLVGRTQEQLLSTAIAAAVRETADLDLVNDAAMSESEASSLLLDASTTPADILILVGETTTLDLANVLACQPELRVLQVHIRSGSVQLDLHSFGLAELMATVRALADRDDATGVARHLLYEGHPDVAQFRIEADQPVATTVESDRLWSAAQAWVDSALKLFHLGRPDGRGDLPGLSLAPDAVENLLLVQQHEESPGISAARLMVDRAADELGDALGACAPWQSPLAAVAQNLGLSTLEFRALLLCLAPELDWKYQPVFGALNDDLGRRVPTWSLVCSILGPGLQVRRELVQAGQLVAWRFILDASQGHPPYSDDAVRVDPHLIAWLLGDSMGLLADSRLRQLVRRAPWPGEAWLRRPVDTAHAQRLSRLFESGREPACVVLAGEDFEGWRAIMEAAASQASKRLIRIVHAEMADVPTREIEETSIRLSRLVLLDGGLVAFDATNSKEGSPDLGGLAPMVERLLENGQSCAVISPQVEAVVGAIGGERTIVFARSAPDAAARSMVLLRAAAQEGLRVSIPVAQDIASSFSLGLADIGTSIRVAKAMSTTTANDDEVARTLKKACRRVASPQLPRFARRLGAGFGLGDVVLPPDRKAQLYEIVSQVVNAGIVLQGWGFDAQLPGGRGVAALFVGGSGTGKTMAAQAIAHELQTDTFVVDLSRVVSKYIGETEKNLDAVFDDAQRAGAVLQFDEADALFGKRSEVKDAHDRYANIETAYLLQRMEAFNGLAILTTNFQQNLDLAFSRRLRFIVDFPRPDAPAREAIWRKCLPAAAPLAEDVDLGFLASCGELTGGNIRQITLRAAFSAAQQQSGHIEMRHLVDATLAELRKLGMDNSERQLKAYLAPRLQPAERAA